MQAGHPSSVTRTDIAWSYIITLSSHHQTLTLRSYSWSWRQLDLQAYQRLFIGPAHRRMHQFAAKCEISQMMKYEATKPASLIQLLPMPNQVREDIAMDFIQGLPRSRGKTTILVAEDWLTKYTDFLTLGQFILHKK